MSDQQDRAITLTFSVRLSKVAKLERLCLAARKNRSELLDGWIERSLVGVDLAAAEPDAPSGEPP